VVSPASHSRPVAQHTQTERWGHRNVARVVVRSDRTDRSAVGVEEVETASVACVAEGRASARGSIGHRLVGLGVRWVAVASCC